MFKDEVNWVNSNTNYYTDKHTDTGNGGGSGHKYGSVYDVFLRDLKCDNLLEVGIDRGGSLLVWKRYFPEAHVQGVDVTLNRLPEPITIDGITTHNSDAYSSEFSNKFSDDFFDLIIDDGPHTVNSQKEFIRLYFPKLKKDGIMIIEDIVNIESARDIQGVLSDYDCDSFIVDRVKVSNLSNEINLIVLK